MLMAHTALYCNNVWKNVFLNRLVTQGCPDACINMMVSVLVVGADIDTLLDILIEGVVLITGICGC